MRSLRHTRVLASAVPGVVALAHNNARAAAAEPAPKVVGAVVVFRHGARSAIFALPDGPSAEYETITAPPPHATSVKVNNGKTCHRYAAPGSPGFLTPLGWSQGESLGRRLRRRYGESVSVSATHSTDTSRTVLTAHAVLTGLLGGKASATTQTDAIDVIRGATLAVDIGCAELAFHLNHGRALHRASDVPNQRARAEIAENFGSSYVAAKCGLLAVHDDCVARHAHGLPPSPTVDNALCELSSRETAREVRAALRHLPLKPLQEQSATERARGVAAKMFGGGPGLPNDYAARLAAGRLLDLIWRHLSDCRTHPADPGVGPKVLLLSGHDTSLLALLNAMEQMPGAAAEGASGGGAPSSPGGAPLTPLVPDDVWPPHCSCIAFELLSDGSVRVCYQWDEILHEPLDVFLSGAKRLALNDKQHIKACGESEATGAVFHWAD